MNNYGLKKMLFLLFLSFMSMKDAARTKTKLTNSNQHNSFSGLALFLKPFQTSPTKRIDMEKFQPQTLEWVHKRLILFTQNIDQKIFLGTKYEKTKLLERVPDKKTVFSLQWEDLKSHFLIPISKRQVHLYNKATDDEIDKLKSVFFQVLDGYYQKLIELEREKSLKIQKKYEVIEKEDFDVDNDLIAEKTALHYEVYSLLDDLPRRIMIWRPRETQLLKDFALVYGPLPDTGNLQQKRENFGGEVKGAKVFSAADLDGNEEEEGNSEKSEDSDSDSSSSSDSSNDDSSGSDYSSDFFEHLTRDYFISDVQEWDHHNIPPESHEHSHKPPADPSESDIETHNRLNALDGNEDWDVKKVASLEKQVEAETIEQRKKNAENDVEIRKLQEELFRSLMVVDNDPEFKEVVREKYPDIITKIEKLKEAIEKLKSPHSSEPSSPLYHEGNGGDFDGSVHGSPKAEQVVRPSAPAPSVQRSLSPGPYSQPPSPVRYSEGVPNSPPPTPPVLRSSSPGPNSQPPSPMQHSDGVPNSPPKPSAPSLTDFDPPFSPEQHGGNSGVIGSMSVEQEKPS